MSELTPKPPKPPKAPKQSSAPVTPFEQGDAWTIVLHDILTNKADQKELVELKKILYDTYGSGPGIGPRVIQHSDRLALMDTQNRGRLDSDSVYENAGSGVDKVLKSAKETPYGKLIIVLGFSLLIMIAWKGGFNELFKTIGQVFDDRETIQVNVDQSPGKTAPADTTTRLLPAEPETEVEPELDDAL